MAYNNIYNLYEELCTCKWQDFGCMSTACALSLPLEPMICCFQRVSHWKWTRDLCTDPMWKPPLRRSGTTGPNYEQPTGNFPPILLMATLGLDASIAQLIWDYRHFIKLPIMRFNLTFLVLKVRGISFIPWGFKQTTFAQLIRCNPIDCMTTGKLVIFF